MPRRPPRLKEKLAKMYDCKDNQLVSVFGFKSQFGGGKSSGFGLIYDNLEAIKQFEPKYRLVRNGLAETVQKSRKQIKERKNRTKKVRGVKKVRGEESMWEMIGKGGGGTDPSLRSPAPPHLAAMGLTPPLLPPPCRAVKPPKYRPFAEAVGGACCLFGIIPITSKRGPAPSTPWPLLIYLMAGGNSSYLAPSLSSPLHAEQQCICFCSPCNWTGTTGCTHSPQCMSTMSGPG